VRGVGVFKSTNGGTSWSLLPNTTSFIVNSRILCDAAGNVYLATMGNGIRRSTDDGDTWIDISPNSVSLRVTDIELSSTGRLHSTHGLGNTTVGGYRYTDNPITVTRATWTAATSGLTYPTGAAVRCEMTCSGNTVYMGAVNPANNKIETLHKSTDGGATWTNTAIPAAN
jgi:photosystem II stability/assembly factor-like uncharacterized protein